MAISCSGIKGFANKTLPSRAGEYQPPGYDTALHAVAKKGKRIMATRSEIQL